MKIMFVVMSLVSISAAATSAQTTQPAWIQNDLGQMMLRSFKNAPYPHPSREHGFRNYPEKGHYDDSTVGIFIPNDYRPEDRVNYVVHFHGFENYVAKVLARYQLPRQLDESKVNAILIVPQGPKNARDAGGGKLELNKNGLMNLLEEITTFLKSDGKIKTDAIGKVVISSHSGGYRVAAAVLDHGGMDDHITDVLLLDSSYGSLDQFTRWCAGGKHRRLVSIFTDHLASTNKQFMDLLARAQIRVDFMEDTAVTEPDLMARWPIFIHTTLPHDEVPMKTEFFRRLLETSDLPKNN